MGDENLRLQSFILYTIPTSFPKVTDVAVLKMMNQTINSIISSIKDWNEAIAYEAVIRMVEEEDISQETRMSVGRQLQIGVICNIAARLITRREYCESIGAKFALGPFQFDAEKDIKTVQIYIKFITAHFSSYQTV